MSLFIQMVSCGFILYFNELAKKCNNFLIYLCAILTKKLRQTVRIMTLEFCASFYALIALVAYKIRIFLLSCPCSFCRFLPFASKLGLRRAALRS